MKKNRKRLARSGHGQPHRWSARVAGPYGERETVVVCAWTRRAALTLAAAVSADRQAPKNVTLAWRNPNYPIA